MSQSLKKGRDNMSEDKTSTNEVWRETGGEQKVLDALERQKELMEDLSDNLAKCPICCGRAKIVIFGREGNGVWVGCDKTGNCMRYIEIHTEGWSIEDTVRDWNWRNSGWRRCIRRAKGWYRVLFGREGRIQKRIKRELEAKKEAELAKRREVFGIIQPKKAKKWWKVW